MRPDVVVMDIRMPRLDGIQATRRLLATGATTPRILVLTTFDLDEYVFEALRAGASGFMLKDAPPDRLITGIRTVASGEALLAPPITQRLIERYVTLPPAATARRERFQELTEREMEVLWLLTRGLSNAEIGEKLFLSGPPSRPTSRACCRRWACATGCKRSCLRTRAGSSSPDQTRRLRRQRQLLSKCANPGHAPAPVRRSSGLDRGRRHASIGTAATRRSETPSSTENARGAAVGCPCQRECRTRPQRPRETPCSPIASRWWPGPAPPKRSRGRVAIARWTARDGQKPVGAMLVTRAARAGRRLPPPAGRRT
jgi:FixJ family two-component response regulator